MSKVKQSFHTTPGWSGCFEFLFWFRSTVLFPKKKSQFFNFSSNPSVTNLFIDCGGKYELENFISSDNSFAIF